MGPSDSLLARLGINLPKNVPPTPEQARSYETMAKEKTKGNKIGSMIEGTGGFMEGLLGTRDFQSGIPTVRDTGNALAQMAGAILPFARLRIPQWTSNDTVNRLMKLTGNITPEKEILTETSKVKKYLNPNPRILEFKKDK